MITKLFWILYLTDFGRLVFMAFLGLFLMMLVMFGLGWKIGLIFLLSYIISDPYMYYCHEFVPMMKRQKNKVKRLPNI